MRKRRLKRFVLPTIYVLIVVTSFLSISIINNLLISNVDDYDYSKSLVNDTIKPTIAEQKTLSISKPYVSENVKIATNYYNKDDETDRQENSLILYHNTYMPSSGVIYSSNEEFEVVSVLDGKVTKIYEDDILGTVIEITHNTNLTTYYYSLKDVIVSENEQVTQGTIIGRATTNKINENENNFLFEVYYQGKSIDPEVFYTMSLDELQ